MQTRRLLERLLFGLAAILTLLLVLPADWLGLSNLPRDYLAYALGLILLFALTRYARVMLILVIGGMVLLANLPGALAPDFDRSTILLTLGLIILGGGANYFLKLLPSGLDDTPKRSASTQGVAALLTAIRQGETVRVHRFLDSGVNLDGMVLEQTPLTVAAAAGHADIVKLLLDAGASPDLPNGQGDSALVLAQRYGHLPVVALLDESSQPPATAGAA